MAPSVGISFWTPATCCTVQSEATENPAYRISSNQVHQDQLRPRPRELWGTGCCSKMKQFWFTNVLWTSVTTHFRVNINDSALVNEGERAVTLDWGLLRGCYVLRANPDILALAGPARSCLMCVRLSWKKVEKARNGEALGQFTWSRIYF